MRVCGKRIRELREERGYSLQELAQKASVSVSYLSEIERGAKGPSLKTLQKISKALNYPQEQLLETGGERGIVLGEKLRILRERAGRDLSSLAEAAGISVSYLSEIERGHVYPAISTLKKIAAALEIPLSSLISSGGSLGHKLRQIREEQGLTQAELAKAAGVSAGLIGQIEHGKVQPSLKTLEKIGRVLDVSPCYFIADDAGLEEILSQMSPELRQLLLEPQVQSVLRLICNCSEAELRFILNFIQLYKRSH
ncbi:MAG: helix-turn-helix domain-containing protein [Clostridia bacterium]|nr:helix-turn-helix domain-containing protein [Clostridia bacterium]